MASASAPIFFLPVASAAHGRIALAQAKASNPGRKIVLLDLSNGSDFLHAATVCINQGDNQPDGHFWLFGTDTLLFDDLTHIEDALTGCDMAVLHRNDRIHAVYTTQNALTNMAGVSNSTEENTQFLEKLEDIAYSQNVQLEYLNDIRSGLAFDADFGDAGRLRMSKDGKARHLVWADGRPFVINQATGLVARAVAIRFGSDALHHLHRVASAHGIVTDKILLEARALFS